MDSAMKPALPGTAKAGQVFAALFDVVFSDLDVVEPEPA
jgi:hypothetical protein